MESYATWLGKENGREMVTTVFKSFACSKEQARAAVTTYCVLWHVEVDTMEWDELMRYLFDYYNCWFDDYDEFDNYMCEDLI